MGDVGAVARAMRHELITQLTRIADALEILATRERRRVCRHCGQADCQGHATLPDAEGPFTKPVLVKEPELELTMIGVAHREISRAAELIVEDERRAARWQRRYRPVEAERA